MIKKVLFAITIIAVSVLATLGIVYRKDVGDWFDRTFKQTEVVEVEEDAETEEAETTTASGMPRPGDLVIRVEG